VRRADCIDGPMISITKSDYGSDTYDGVVYMFWKLIPERFSDFVRSLADELVSGRETGQVRHGLQVPDNDTVAHGGKRPPPLNSLRRAGSRFVPAFSGSGPENCSRSLNKNGTSITHSFYQIEAMGR
jgi:hypothetical protein